MQLADLQFIEMCVLSACNSSKTQAHRNYIRRTL